ncbi:MAG TPA: rhomboid family intramembrane serine protease, partial [Myxococcota bacterium]|nr:rhomboid family intramembrane serine protease [Myxococcota bacterium]
MSTSRPSSAQHPQPWLSCALLLVCAIALTYSRQLEREVRAASAAAAERAADYWSERPYLEPAEIVVRHLGSDTIESRRAEHRRERSQTRALAVPKAVKSHYQEILDGLTAEALEPLSKLPQYRLGVRGAEGDGRAYLVHAFLHGGWPQLAGNGVLLIVLGFAIERIWGHALFAAVALASSLAAAVAFRLGNPELDAAWIGASGMLAGLLGAFAVRFAARWSEPGYGGLIAAGACWLLAPGALGWNASLVAGPTASGPIEGAAQASLWGIAGGFACGLAFGALIVFGRIEST